MSDKKLQKEYVDHGFGFLIRLRNVPMVKSAGHGPLTSTTKRWPSLSLKHCASNRCD